MSLKNSALLQARDSDQLPPAALTEAQTAKYINMSRSYLRQDRMNGHRANRTPGPPYVRLGRSIRYRLVDLDNWLESHLASTGVAE